MPDPQSQNLEEKRELGSHPISRSLSKDQQQSSGENSSFECSSLGMTWIQVPNSVLMSRSLRIPDFMESFRASVGSTHLQPFQSRVLQFQSPISGGVDSLGIQETYLVWNSLCDERRIQAAEFQYFRVGRDNHVYTGRAHRLPNFQEMNQLWYLPLAKVFSSSEQSAWRVNQNEGDLHQIVLKFNIQEVGWKTLEVHFYLNQRTQL